MSQVCFTDVSVVAPDRVIEGGTVVVADGVVTDVLSRTVPPGPNVYSLGGRYLLPGFVDLHNDSLDREVTLRDERTAVDPDYAMAQYDRRLAAAGVTTAFHAVSFIEHPTQPWRTLAFGTRLAAAVRTLRRAPYVTVDHRIAYRLEMRIPGALDATLAALDHDDDPTPIVVVALHNLKDQRPLRLEMFRSRLRGDYGSRANGTVGTPAHTVMEYGAETDEARIAHALERVLMRRAERGLILASHDDDEPERVDMQADLGYRIAEFPMTVAAAARARERGLAVEVGAPNALRGRSYQGAVSARELVVRRVADILVADYHAPALLGAVFRLAAEGLTSLPHAVAMATANPACVVGLTDRGAIAPGQRADLVVACLHGSIPTVDATLVRGEFAYRSGQWS